MTTTATEALPARATRPAGFATMSHPERDERDFSPEPPKPVNEELRLWLLGLKEKGESNATIGSQLGYRDGSMVSKYLNNKCDGDVAKFERAVADLRVRLDAARPEPSSSLFETAVTTRSWNFCKLVSASHRCGILHGEPGLGKSCGVRIYAKAHPTAIYLEADMARRDDLGVRRLLWNSIVTRGKNNDSRWDRIIDHYAGSDRCVIIDQAQRLNQAGLFQVYDFRDKTGCPVVLVGAPSIIDHVARDANNFSRTFQCMEVKASLLDAQSVAAALVELHAARFESDDLVALVADSVAAPGHMRVAVDTLYAAHAYVALPDCRGDFCKAYRKALAMSVHNPASASKRKAA